jgi:hypothetical protein
MFKEEEKTSREIASTSETIPWLSDDDDDDMAYNKYLCYVWISSPLLKADGRVRLLTWNKEMEGFLSDYNTHDSRHIYKS